MTREKGQAFCLLVQAPPGEAGLYSEEGMYMSLLLLLLLLLSRFSRVRLCATP